MGGGKTGIAPTTPATPGYHNLLAVLEQIGYDFPAISILHYRAYREPQNKVVTGCSMPVLALPMSAPFSPIVPFVTEINQGPQPFVSPENNVAATAPVTSPGSAFRYILFPAHGHAPVATIAALDIYPCLIKKHHNHLWFSLTNYYFSFPGNSKKISTPPFTTAMLTRPPAGPSRPPTASSSLSNMPGSPNGGSGNRTRQV
ncbi:MAG: hypothetical protein BWY80_01064 [Firmicutes bacterium ADurb.Bin456]|nr:MAG: hypothetical protein BWY80_01064 [Firmicutes bacterium ADurb.Bin456]